MKKLFAVFALAVLAVSAPAAFADGEYPNIVGRWVGYIMAINQQCALQQRGKAVYVFEKQDGPVFSGYMEARYPDGTKYSKPVEGFVGGVGGNDDFDIVFSDDKGGFAHGDLAMDWREMALYHVEPGGEGWATVTNLRRTRK
jgi:hypothetical protein